jgi:hypothetical protein
MDRRDGVLGNLSVPVDFQLPEAGQPMSFHGREVHMSRVWKLSLLLTVALMLMTTISLSQASKGPAFTAQDRELIEAYYKRIIGTLAPGSLDRTPLPLGVEQALVVGGHVPMSVEKDLERLPEKLESQLSQTARSNHVYKLGRHILLVTDPGVIADILKNVAPKVTKQ